MYTGSLNGEPITGILIGFVGFYFCKEEHCGKGYGFKTWKIARALLSSEINLLIDSEKVVVHLYEREGFSF